MGAISISVSVFFVCMDMMPFACVSIINTTMFVSKVLYSIYILGTKKFISHYLKI